jgi:hypothetical protein
MNRYVIVRIGLKNLKEGFGSISDIDDERVSLGGFAAKWSGTGLGVERCRPSGLRAKFWRTRRSTKDKTKEVD